MNLMPSINPEPIGKDAVTPLPCDACDKNMRNMETGTTFVGMSIQTYSSPTEIEYLSQQLGPYKVDKTYNICLECLLKSLGVKP